MKRTLVGLIVALALAVGLVGLSPAPPADAQTITPTVPIFVIHGTCAGWVSGASYGPLAIAQFDEQSGSVCHVESAIEVVAYRGGGLFNTWQCSWWGFLYNPYGSCRYNWRQVQALTPGSFVGVNLRLCYGPTLSTFSCVERFYSIWG